MTKRNLYNNACAYLEYLGGSDVTVPDELSQELAKLEGQKLQPHVQQRSSALGSLALLPEYLIAKHRLRQEALRQNYGNSADDLERLAIAIKKRTELARYSRMPTLGSTALRAERLKLIKKIDRGEVAESVGLALVKILNDADESGLKQESWAIVSGTMDEAVDRGIIQVISEADVTGLTDECRAIVSNGNSD